jgi:hypothetical protein
MSSHDLVVSFIVTNPHQVTCIHAENSESQCSLNFCDYYDFLSYQRLFAQPRSYGHDIGDEDHSSRVDNALRNSVFAHALRRIRAVLVPDELSILSIPFPPPLVQGDPSCSLNVCIARLAKVKDFEGDMVLTETSRHSNCPYFDTTINSRKNIGTDAALFTTEN